MSSNNTPVPLSALIAGFTPMEGAVRRVNFCERCDGEAPINYRICKACNDAYANELSSKHVADALATIPERYRWARFSAPELSERVKPLGIASEVARARSMVVLLAGPSGAGKTSLACSLFRSLIESGEKRARGSLFAFSADVGRAATETRFGEEPLLVARCKRVPLLVLDDLGTEIDRTQRCEASASVADVLLERERAERMTIITTYQRHPEVAARYGDGLARRLTSYRVFKLGAVMDIQRKSGVAR